jgi:hypothetical protein
MRRITIIGHLPASPEVLAAIRNEPTMGDLADKLESMSDCSAMDGDRLARLESEADFREQQAQEIAMLHGPETAQAFRENNA